MADLELEVFTEVTDGYSEESPLLDKPLEVFTEVLSGYFESEHLNTKPLEVFSDVVLEYADVGKLFTVQGLEIFELSSAQSVDSDKKRFNKGIEKI